MVYFLAYFLVFYLVNLLAYMRSGREYLAEIFEVRGVGGRGQGPVGNSGRGYSRLRSGREYWAVMVVVKVRQGRLGMDGRG